MGRFGSGFLGEYLGSDASMLRNLYLCLA